MPVDLSRAIYHANRILDWQENLTEEEMPPVWMWIFEDELGVWFERITTERNERYSNPGDSGSGGGEMMSNEYAAGRRG